MTQLKLTFSALALAVLAACGGGGGDAGTPSSGTGSNTGTTGTGSTDTSLPVLGVQLLDASGTPLTAPVLSQTETRTLQVTLKNAQGQALT